MIVLLLKLAAGLALLLVLGAGLLLLTGVWSQCRGVLRLVLSVFVGAAAVAVVLPWFVYLRVAPAVPLVAALAAVALAAGLAVNRRRPAAPSTLRPPRLGPIELVWLLAPFAVLAIRAIVTIRGGYDAFSNWVLKAKLLYFAGNGIIDERIFELTFATNGSPPVERVYPIGLPSLDAYVMHAMGNPSLRLLHLLFVVLLAGVAAVVMLVLRPHVAPWLLVVGVSFFVWMPAIRDQALSANADVPLACFWVASALALAGYLTMRNPGLLLLATLFGAAAVAIKREGAIFTAVLWVLALIATSPRRPLILRGAVIAATAIPWRVFVAVNDLTGHDIGPSAGRIIEHLDELPLITREIGSLLVDPAFLGVVPLAVVAAILLTYRSATRRLAAAYLAVTAALLLTLLLVYLNSRPDTTYLLRTSAHRALATPSLLAAAVLPLLLGRLFGVERTQAVAGRSPLPP